MPKIPDYDNPGTPQEWVVSPKSAEGYDDQTSLQLLQMLVDQPGVEKNTQLEEEEPSTLDDDPEKPSNNLSDRRTQAIQTIVREEFSEEITTIIDAITENGIDEKIFNEKRKEITKALAGGRGRQGITLFKKAGKAVSIDPREKTKKAFQKPTLTKEEKEDPALEDITAKEIEQALRELPALQEKIAEVLIQKTNEITILTTPQNAREPFTRLSPLGKIIMDFHQGGFKPNDVWRRSQAGKQFTETLQALGKQIKIKSSLVSAYDKFLETIAVFEKGIIKPYLANDLLTKSELNDAILLEQQGTTKQQQNNAEPSSTKELPASGFTPVSPTETTNTKKPDTKKPDAITVKASAQTNGTKTYPSDTEIAEATKKNASQKTTNKPAAKDIQTENPDQGDIFIIDENTKLRTTFMSRNKEGPQGRGSILTLPASETKDKVFHIELDYKFNDQKMYSFQNYQKRYLNFHGSAGSDEALMQTLINDTNNLSTIAILSNGAIVLFSHPKHGGIVAGPEAMIKNDPLFLEHSIPVEFSVHELPNNQKGPDGETYDETKTPNTDQQEAFVRLQRYLEAAYGYKRLIPVSSAQVVTGADKKFITPPASDTNGLDTDTFSRRRDAQGNLTDEGKQIAKKRGREPALCQTTKPLASMSLPELLALDTELTRKLKALSDPQRIKLLNETTTHGKDYFTTLQKTVQDNIKRLEAAEKTAHFNQAKIKGDEAYAKQQRQEAQDAYEEALTIFPNDAYCKQKLADTKQKLQPSPTPPTPTPTPTPSLGNTVTGGTISPKSPESTTNRLVDESLGKLKIIIGPDTRLSDNMKAVSYRHLTGDRNKIINDMQEKIIKRIQNEDIAGVLCVCLPLTANTNETEKRKQMKAFFDKNGIYEQLVREAQTKNYEVFFVDSYPDQGEQSIQLIKNQQNAGLRLLHPQGGIKNINLNEQKIDALNQLIPKAKEILNSQ